ncbi:hypothetical protein CDL12_15465 [Handroanthus impetiginosus]|uniref:Retrotransposon Copia-like N-terminal domain-containing protein n=1 Tax=Handroanthus impetiginosus TaxID=429701 RepID=A0A2G9H332_9LAMI|nr:hypothetical protein CDL12_15465 [Handroanthus impetiginosus]
MIISWIFNSIDITLHQSIAYMYIAKSMWEDLRDHFSQGNGPRIYELKTQEAELRQEGLSFWMGLNSSMYGTVRSQILSIDPLPSLSRVYAMVAQEERHKMVSRGHEEKRRVVTFAAQNVGKFKGKGFGSSNRRQQLFCSHCNKSGHDVSQCYKIIGYPANWGQRCRGTDHSKPHHAAYQGSGAPASSTNNGSNTIGPGGNNSVSVPGLRSEEIIVLLSLLETSKPGAKTLSGPLFEESNWSG